MKEIQIFLETAQDTDLVITNKIHHFLKSGAIAKHPRRDFAERRAFCIKQRAFDHIIFHRSKIRSVKGFHWSI